MRVEEKQRSPRGEDDDTPWWKPEIDHWQSTPFSILDAEGRRLFIDTHAIHFRVVEHPSVNDAPEVNDDNPHFGAFLRANGLPTTRHMGIAGEHRFYEWTLRPGDRVAAYGRAAVLAEVGAAGYRDVATTRWSLGGTAEGPVMIYELLND